MMIDILRQDLRFAVRTLRRSPGFTLVALVTLALGIGANSAILSLIDAALLRPLPGLSHPERLVRLSGALRGGGRAMPVSYLDYRDVQAAHIFAGLALFRSTPFNVGGDDPERLDGEVVTGNYFDVLGVTPDAGRAFLPEEDSIPGAVPVAVISHRLWARRFASDPAVAGKPIVLNGQRFTVIGVAPEGFIGAELSEHRPDVWVPMMMLDAALPNSGPLLQSRLGFFFDAVARLAPGQSPEAAQARLSTVSAGMLSSAPEERSLISGMKISRPRGGLTSGDAGGVASLALLGLGITAIVLLIACANVANLLLGRAASRRREIGIRLAIGASHGRLVRQLLTESLLLALVAGALGLAAAYWTTGAALSWTGLSLPLDVSPDARILLATLGVSLLTGLLFGLVPALHAARPGVQAALHEGGGGGTRRPHRLQNGFVVAQLALSIVLLASAGLLLRSLSNATHVDLGFSHTSDVVAMSFDLGTQGYAPDRRETFNAELLERVRALPGVEATSLAESVPMGGILWGNTIIPEGQEAAAAAPDNRFAFTGSTVFFDNIWPGYFATLGLPLRGRDFTDADRKDAPGVVIVSEATAKRYWPKQDPIGKRLRIGKATSPLLTVVGVAGDSKVLDLSSRGTPYMYIPERQMAGVRTEMTLVARGGSVGQLTPALERTIHTMDPALPVFHVQTVAGYLHESLTGRRTGSAMVAAFGVLALLLATIGIYGVMAFAVAQRTREIGVRIALGARQRDVLRLFVGRGLRLALIGTIGGVLLALAATRVIGSMLFGVTATDALSFAGAALLLGGAVLVASWIPSRRAARVDPVVALRSE